LEVKGLEVRLDYQIPLTPHVRLIMDSFGIEATRIRSKLVGPANLSVVPGSVVLITGASGSGKSVLLAALAGLPLSQGLIRHVALESPMPVARMLHPLPDGAPIFEYFAKLYGPERAFDALCQVGLSEAMVFIKPFGLLSMGQRYRAMFADLILSGADCWLLDEFGTNLDPITAKVVSARLKKLAFKKQKLVLVAAANTSHFLEALAPDEILVVRTGGDVQNMRMKDYNNGFFNEGF
jgi:ABC-type ATPase with predicted acetyltransferase domain